MSAGTALKSVWSVIKWTVNSDILVKLSVKKMGLRFLTLALVPLQKMERQQQNNSIGSSTTTTTTTPPTACFHK